MSFSQFTKQIGREYLKAKQEPFAGHPLANIIRHEWPRSLREILSSAGNPLDTERYRVAASAGLGQWSDAPWLAILDIGLTDSATYGFYPVFLFEPAFETVCLVLGQGAERLTRALGRKLALQELALRSEQLRKHSAVLEGSGFVRGPFATMRRASAAPASKADQDPWSVSVAYGKRYQLATMPSDAALAEDLKILLKHYKQLAKQADLQFAKEDAELGKLKGDGELPDGSVDGARRTIWHKRIEARIRNGKLIDEVKRRLGSTCQACGFSFEAKYGTLMQGYIEAHHVVPISTLPEGGALLKPTPDDFMVLCSNCHRAIHRAGCPDLDSFRRGLEP